MTGAWRRRRVLALLAAACVALGAVTVGARVHRTSASWTDTEFAHGVLGVWDCDDPGFTTNAAGRFLWGQALGIDLDTVAELMGLTVTNNGTSSSANPASATSLGDDAYRSVVDVGLLDSNAPILSAALGLSLPGQAAGVYNQYGQALRNGRSTGAAGAVTDEGAVRISESDPDPGLPGSASVHLGSLLPDVADLADARLDVGAVASSATLNGCANPQQVQRDYGIASLRLVQGGSLVPDLLTTIQDEVAAAEATIQALETGLIDNVTGLLGSLGALTVDIDLVVDLDGAIADLLDDERRTGDDSVVIDPVAGTVTVDLDALASSQGAAGLNGRDPNTELLDGTFFATLLPHAVTSVTDLVDDLTGDVLTTVNEVLENTQLHISVAVPLLSLTVLEIEGALIEDPEVPDDELRVTLVNGLVGAVLGAQVLSSVLTEVDSVVGSALSTLTGALAPLAGDVGDALDTTLMALDVLSLMVNVKPDQPGAPPGMGTAPGVSEVDALVVRALPTAPNVLTLGFARSRVGPNAELDP